LTDISVNQIQKKYPKINSLDMNLKVGIIQQHNTADIADNRARLAQKMEQLAKDGAQLIVNQELHDSLYFCQTENVDLCSLATAIPSEVTEFYSQLASRLGVVIVTSLFERRAPGLYHNTAVVFERDGSIAGKYRKMHIPDDPAYYEKFYFTPGDMGFEPISTSVGKLGVLVCWDQWYPEAARLMALRGAEILIYPTAIGTESSDTPEEQARQREAWVTIQRAHGVANGLPVVSVNRVGHEPDPSGQTRGITFWGTSFVAGPQGEFIYQSPVDCEDMAVIDIDMARSENVRRWWPFLRDRRIDAYGGLTKRFLD
jgi:N-carbamoylputrescine amidase